MALRWLANLILLLMLLGLGLGIWHVLTVEENPPTLAGIDPADLRLIEVERTGEPRIRLERTPDGWRMREPMDLPADQGQVERLLGLAATLVERSFPAKSAALAELGLAPPKLRLTLDQTTLGFGGLDPQGQRRYVLADSLVHLIGDGLYPRLIAPPIDYASRRLLPGAPPPVFATLNGVPLAAPSLKAVAGLTAERLEPMTADLSGEPLEVKLADGTLLRFLVSPDRRRWARPDQRLSYVLGDGLLLELDPTAKDPGPPAIRPPAAPAVVRSPNGGARPAAVESAQAQSVEAQSAGAAPPADEADPFAPPVPGAVQAAPGPAGAADGALSLPGEAPPVVRLRPDQGVSEPGLTDESAVAEPPVGFGAEPAKRPPEGFGVDPFAPTPAPATAPAGVAPGGGGAPPTVKAPAPRRP